MPFSWKSLRCDVTSLVVAVALVAATVVWGLLLNRRPISEADGQVLHEMVLHRSEATTTLMRAITDFFSPTVTLVLAALIAGLLAWRRSPAAAVFVLGSTAAAAAIAYVLKAAFARQRPPVIDHLVDEHDFGFPSGHVTGTTALLVATTIALTVGWSTRRALLALVVPAVFVGAVAASRLYLGVHWFSDTAAGVAIGLAGIAAALAVLPPASWAGIDHRIAAVIRRGPVRRPVSARR
ncbi:MULTISPECIES: phosphatase PAP2 family protein [Tsukamurella]|uniref:Phosphatase PAP2 family protein n=1 Tax=Tsukamurella strandjordii TaxID=147577 RepID=A0AA90NJC4_9ACTN|nr:MULTISPECIES: phosphatase PAP2 family protein [Tsukamurella]MDP0399795.1 phosphatase PAP2 family protein [Tsukamurella strandjordii]GIZ97393.1 hypothetical protein TTY48_20050 [Tsukamurella sp. TY48]